MKCKNLIKTIAVLAATPVAVLSMGATTHAEPGTCSITGIMCLASGTTAGLGEEYRFATDDTNLNNNTYGNGTSVNDNNRAIRDRKSGTTRACAYVDNTYQSGATGYANYTGATWVNLLSSSGSSIRFRTTASC
jgi:hypothetical protein